MRAFSGAGLAAVCALAAGLTADPAAAQQTWVINEVFTNADGSEQYVELREAESANGGDSFTGLSISTTDWVCTFESDLPSTQTADQFLLLGTTGFADIGGTQPDAVIPDAFVEPSAGDVIDFASLDMFFINAGELPAGEDGLSLHRSDGVGADGVATASATNFVAGGAGLAIQCPEPALALAQLAALATLLGLARLRRSA